jgi:hypothetical protein
MTTFNRACVFISDPIRFIFDIVFPRTCTWLPCFGGSHSGHNNSLLSYTFEYLVYNKKAPEGAYATLDLMAILCLHVFRNVKPAQVHEKWLPSRVTVYVPPFLLSDLTSQDVTTIGLTAVFIPSEPSA